MDYHVVNIVSFVKELIHAKPVWSYINLNLIFSVIYYLGFFLSGTALVVVYLILLALYYFAPSPAGC